MPEQVPVLTDVLPQSQAAAEGFDEHLGDGYAKSERSAASSKVPLELIPVLADRIIDSDETESTHPAANEALTPANPVAVRDAIDASHIDRAALEAKLLEGLKASVAQMLEVRVQAAVTPALALLADRLAYKASQELAATLTDSMQDELIAAVREAVEGALDNPER